MQVFIGLYKRYGLVIMMRGVYISIRTKFQNTTNMVEFIIFVAAKDFKFARLFREISKIYYV